LFLNRILCRSSHTYLNCTGLAVLNQCYDLVMRITSRQTACVLLPGSRRRQAHLVVYLPHGRLQRTTQSKPPGATEGRSLRLNGQGVVVSRNAACVNIGLTFSGGSTPFFKFADPPFRNHYLRINCTTRRFGDETSPLALRPVRTRPERGDRHRWMLSLSLHVTGFRLPRFKAPGGICKLCRSKPTPHGDLSLLCDDCSFWEPHSRINVPDLPRRH
jgi:hypothetical protein